MGRHVKYVRQSLIGAIPINQGGKSSVANCGYTHAEPLDGFYLEKR